MRIGIAKDKVFYIDGDDIFAIAPKEQAPELIKQVCNVLLLKNVVNSPYSSLPNNSKLFTTHLHGNCKQFIVSNSNEGNSLQPIVDGHNS